MRLTDGEPKTSGAQMPVQISPIDSRLDATVKVLLIDFQDLIHLHDVQ